MRFGKVFSLRLVVAVLVFSMWQIMPHSVSSPYTKACIATEQIAHQDFATKGVRHPAEECEKSAAAKPKDRADSIRAVVSHLGLGKGSVIADIGAGNGKDTWVFAEIVGETGKVYPEEIAEDKVKSLEDSAKKKGLAQIIPVLGRSDDPCLPPDSTDLVYMNRVYHHFAKPREMLRGIWRSLRPGGYLVVVDQRRGTLRDWVPRQVRENKHHWIAETTVVREAREEGFSFVSCAEDYWHEQDPFVLVFQRPKKLKAPGSDPDVFRPISVEDCCHLFLPSGGHYQNPAFVALGEARGLIAPILEHSSGKGLDIVLEEWATQKDERPILAAGVSLPSVLTKEGDPNLRDEPIDVVFFLDSYHLLFHGKTLLSKLHERLMPTGRIYVLDRRSKKPLSRREASHRKEILPKTVEQEMTEAGFSLWFRGPRLARDRFLLVFGKARSKKAASGSGPMDTKRIGFTRSTSHQSTFDKLDSHTRKEIFASEECANESNRSQGKYDAVYGNGPTQLRVATGSPAELGLLKVLAEAFASKENVTVCWMKAGSGKSLQLLHRLDADVAIVHAPAAEAKAVSDGWATHRTLIGSNEFFLVGPADDPAGIKTARSAAEAYRKIAATRSLFFSRGDNSGTHKREMEIWEKAGMTPDGQWYVTTGDFMTATLRRANTENGYFMTDSSTWFMVHNELANLQLLLRGDTVLVNIYHALCQPLGRTPSASVAANFVEFLISKRAQQIISHYGVNNCGVALYKDAQHTKQNGQLTSI